jgi:aspartate carbamoyltransferase catalytic subunit
MVRHLLDIADLADSDVDAVLHEVAGDRAVVPRDPFVVGLLFQTSSLRTRAGFAVAAARLGGTSVTVEQSRFSGGMSAAESFDDTLRTLAGMVDLVVVRPDRPLDRLAVRAHAPAPVVNGGDPVGEHPTQALIDVAAMERFAGPLDELHVGISGDLGMRGTRSLLALLGRRPPRQLTLIAPPSRRDPGFPLSPVLEQRTDRRTGGDFADVDVLYLGGLAPGQGPEQLDDAARAPFALTPATAGTLPEKAVVLSPMPVIDEIAPELRGDPRVRVFQQSDLGVRVRTAVLRLLLR